MLSTCAFSCTACTACPAGMYRSDPADSCVPCPANTDQTGVAVSSCPCIAGHFRAPEDGPEVACSRKLDCGVSGTNVQELK